MPAINGIVCHNYTHLNAAGTTTLKPGPGVLHTLTINSPGVTSPLITILDGSNTIAVITPTAAQELTFDCAFLTNLQVTLAGATAPDVTVNWS